MSACDHGTDYSDFDALTIARSGSFELDMNPDDAFPLFTAPGEELWAAGWQPFILGGDGYEAGTVWVTSAGRQTTYWYVAAYDTVGRHAQYVRVKPGVSAGTVDVRVAANGTGSATVNVSYRLTGLSDAGNRNVEELLSEAGYAEMMEEWRGAINANRDRIDAHFVR